MKRAVLILAVLSGVLAVLVVVLLLARAPSSPTPSRPAERKILYYRDPMNPSSTSPTPRKAPDGMDYVPVYEESGQAGASAEGGVRIDPTVVQNIGVKIAPVARRDLSKVIRTVGRVDYDETRQYDITTKIAGYIDRLYIDFTGQRVHKNEPLLEIYSPEVMSAQEEYLVALRNLASVTGRGAPEEIDSARRLVASSRRRLTLWDIPDHEIAELERRGEVRRTVMLHSPVDGTVIEKMVLKGAAIEPGMNLFKIADLSRVWVYADVYEYELSWVKVGEEAQVELSYLPGKVFRGKVVYIDPSLSSQTRTARVRIELPNPTGEIVLRPNMFATVRLLAEPLRAVLVVPDQAVIRSGERTLLVLAVGEGRFVSREVRLGASADSLVQVLEGVEEGEQIVTSSQFLIDSESNLRAAIGVIAPPGTPSTTAPAGAAVPADSAGVKQSTQEPGMDSMPGMEMPGMNPESTHSGRH